MKPVPETVEAHIAAAPTPARAVLKKIRAIVRKISPGGEERISYGMPAVFVDGRALIYFAAFKDHIGLFPPARGDAAFMKAIAPYSGPKGNLSFPHDKPVPYPLIERMIRARLGAVKDPSTTKVNAKAPRKKAAAKKTAKAATRKATRQ